ncbi:MAG: glycosyltransferase, partial [Saprospiraceae bacterium]
MKIAFITTYDRKGGAAQSSWRTALALRKAGVEVKVVVQQAAAEENFVVPTNAGWKKMRSFTNEYLDRLTYIRHAPERSLWFRFSIGEIGQDISQLKAIQEADVLHLHWINKGYLSIKSLEQLAALGKPIIWSLHDMWSFTGGCHYAGDCDHFERTCGNCWYLKSPQENDLSHRMWQRKKLLYDQVRWTMVASSAWLANVAKRSSLLKAQDIMNIPTPV